MERPSHPDSRRFSSFGLNTTLYASTQSTRGLFNLQHLKQLVLVCMISHWLEMRLPKCKRIFFISKQNTEKKSLERPDFIQKVYLFVKYKKILI
jgi:hypothetical protein